MRGLFVPYNITVYRTVPAKSRQNPPFGRNWLLFLGLFGLFAEWKIPSIRWVNTAAKGALGVYLIHDTPIMRAWLWPHLAWVYALGPAAILAVGVLSGIVVYAVGAAIDLARIRLLERPVMGWISERFAQPLEKGNRWLADLKSSR